MDVIRAIGAATGEALLVGGFAYLSALALGGPLWGAAVGIVAFCAVFIKGLDR
jgi:hypothetical protein